MDPSSLNDMLSLRHPLAPSTLAGVLMAGVLMAGVLLFGSGCGSDSEDASANSEEAERNAMVLGAQDVATADSGAVQSGVALSGSLEPYEQVNVKAQVPGTVTGVRLDAGDPVRRGRAMARIQAEGIRSQASSARAAVASAKEQVALARRQMESAKALYEAGAMSEIDYESARSRFEAAQAQLANAKAQAASAGEQARRATIVAPLTGVISERQIEEGEAVAAGQTLFTVVNSDVLELNGQVSAGQAAQIAVGQPVTFRLDAYPRRTFRGVVDRIDPMADPQTRQVGVHLRLPNEDGQLVGGLFATGRVLHEDIDNALVIPAAAVRTSGGSPYVFAVRDGHLQRQPIQIQTRDEQREMVAVASGLKAGDRVVTAPAVEVTEGTPVRLTAETGPSSDGPRPSATPDTL